ncbi:MAG: response regulator [Bacilli bacterium]|nr:response regulator [Bacilli bacterium]
MLTIPVTIITMIYMLLLTVVYFGKERISTIENKLYANIIRLSCFGIILDSVSCMLVIENMINTVYFRFVTLLIFIYYVLWSGLFLIYIYVISFKKNNSDKDFYKKHQRNIKLIAAFYLLCALVIIFLPLNYHVENTAIFPEGASVDLTYFVAGFISIGAMLILMVINRKEIKSKKYVPLYALLILLAVATVIQKLNPGLILTTAVECFITFLMYFTVENPDVQLIRELYKNKKIIEKSNEDTSRFLFRLTGDIKNPVKQLLDLSNDMIKMNDKEQLKEAAKYINSYSTQLDYLINKTLNISNVDTQKLKIFETRYNVNNLFKEISIHIKEESKENVEFNYNIDGSIPKILYGDAIKLKQAITALLLESVSHTEEGFINLDISALTKYNVCRLMIQIEDSGIGMDIEQVNSILSLEAEDLENIDIENIEENKINLKIIKKIINVLGGSLLIKSEVNKGTTFTIVLDQKIVETQDNVINKRLETYEQSLYTDKKFLVIDEDEKELDRIVEILKETEAIITSSVYERDCIEKVRSKNKYDLIILDDEMPNYSALNILQELQKISGFKTPVVVMINDNKEGIKLQYLKDGFADCIMKSKLESEIRRIIKRFQ